MNVYFENVRFYHYPLVKYYLLRKFDIYVFDTDFKLRKKKWLRDLIDTQKISRILANYVFGNGDLALNSIDKIYSLVTKKSKLVRAMVQLYDNEDVVLAYKKALTKDLSDFYALQIILNSKEKTLPNNEKIILIPFKYLEILKMLIRCDSFSYKLDKLFIPAWVKYINSVDKLFIRLTTLMGFCFTNFQLITGVLLKALTPSSKESNYQYAIPITNSNFQFKFKEHRTFDFLLDGTDIRRDNTIFLWLSPLNKAILAKLKVGRYNTADCRSRSILMSKDFTLSRDTGIILKKVFTYARQNFLSVLFEHESHVFCSCTLLNTYLQWSIILNNIKFRHYITFNDEGINHIGRNIILNNFNIKTWYYAHSNSFSYLTIDKDADIAKSRHHLWSFLLYDYYIGWNREMIEYQKLHHQKVKNYCNAGCIWSEFIADGGMRQNLESYLEKRGVKLDKISKNFKAISFFDTSFVDDIVCQYPLKDGIKFYNDILKLLNDEPNLFIVIKEKKADTVYSDKPSLVYSRSNKEYSKLLSALRTHPRCCVAGYDADPVTIIKVSDLTITYAFSSPTIEALGARKKAIFYDPANKFRGYYYDEIPDLVAHGYEELKQSIHRLLYEITDRQYEEYLNREILNKVEDFLDGKALTRFRTLLGKS